MDTITNPVNKHQITFLQQGSNTDGKLLEMDSLYPVISSEPPPHYHPYQTETFTVIEGELTIRINGEIRTLKQDDSIVISPNTTHSMWNAKEQKTRVRWLTEPALKTEDFFRNVFGLANDHKVNKNGMPDIFQSALLAKEYSNEFRLSSPPFFIQIILFNVLGIVGRLKGLKSSYPEYLK
jgi:mannose-6-phosphate isomerase-like protein (cupin superfamily)